MLKHALVVLADGFEEVEAVTPIDLLRRAGIEVTTVSITGTTTVTGSHGIQVIADMTLAEAAGKPFDALILPGGMPGSANLAASAELDAVLKQAAAEGRIIAAICAAPAVVLAPKGYLKGRRFTGYPGTEKDVDGALFVPEKTVTDENLITSRGAGTAGLFALAIIERLIDAGTARKVGTATLILEHQ